MWASGRSSARRTAMRPREAAMAAFAKSWRVREHVIGGRRPIWDPLSGPGPFTLACVAVLALVAALAALGF